MCGGVYRHGGCAGKGGGGGACATAAHGTPLDAPRAAGCCRRRVGGRLRAQAEVNLVTALVPSDTACLDSSPGRMRRTEVWISREVMVGFLL